MPMLAAMLRMVFLLLLGFASLVAVAQATTARIDARHERELVRLVRQDCGSCHGMTLQGGLGTPLTREALADKPVENLAATILYGRAGTAMPPWKSLLSEAEAEWIAQRLVEGFPEERR